MKKALPYVGLVAVGVIVAFLVFAFVKTGELPLSVEETYEIPPGSELMFVDATGQGGVALKVKVDLSVMTNLVSGLPLEEDCWVLFGTEPKSETVERLQLVVPEE